MGIKPAYFAAFLLIAIAIGATTHATELATGTVRGVVMSTARGTPVPYANVVVIGTSVGAMRREDGSFVISSVPTGTQRIKVMGMGYETQELTGIEVEPNGVADLRIQLRKWGMTDAEASLVSIGDEVSASSADFRCEIVPAADRFKVGDSPSFDVRIHNDSDETVLLVRSIDGSASGERYPRAILTIEGPRGGLEMRRVVGCGNVNALQPRDFVEIPPGGVFDPFARGWTPVSFHYGHFAKPGRYKVTFAYSTDAGDIRKWQGWPPRRSLSPSIMAHLHRVPRIVVKQSMFVDVHE